MSKRREPVLLIVSDRRFRCDFSRVKRRSTCPISYLTLSPRMMKSVPPLEKKHSSLKKPGGKKLDSRSTFASPPHTTSLTPRTRFLHELNELKRQTNPPPANYTKVRNFGNFSRLLEKRRRKKSVSISLLTSGAEGDFR